MYYVSKGEQQLGPWTIDEITTRLGRAEIAVTDFIYDELSGDWIPLLECQALAAKLREKKPKKMPPPSASVKTIEEGSSTLAPTSTPTSSMTADPKRAIAEAEAEVREVAARPEMETLSKAFSSRRPNAADGEVSEWFVQKGTHRYGPFSYLGLVRALQEKSIYEFDYIWKNGMDRWVRLAEHDAFAPECIRNLKEKTAGETGVFFRRQHPRMPFESEVIVHDNRSVWMGRAFEASAGGSGLVIENATLVPGQIVLLHFASSEELPAFNALCEIVSKKYVREVKDAKTPVTYNVRFIKLDSQAEGRVQEYFRSRSGGSDAVKGARAHG